MKAVVLRGLAVAVAVAAWIDPAIRTRRAARPVVAVLPADPRRDGELAARVARELDRAFTIVDAPLGGVTVIAGPGIPRSVVAGVGPVFGVRGEASPGIVVESVAMPAEVLADERVPVTVRGRVAGAIGGEATVRLHAGGMPIDERVVPVDRAGRVRARLDFLAPRSRGATVVGVEIAAGPHRAQSRAVLAVRAARRRVLFLDGRPSWASTFVRRVVEQDPGFAVVSRVATSRGVATEQGTPPRGPLGVADLLAFDVVVVGAPEDLSASDVGVLEGYLRRRGGSVVLLPDRRAAGAHDRLARTAWRAQRVESPAAVRLVADSSLELRATELAWPVSMPPGAAALATDSAGRDIIWTAPVGAGRLVVSGALDAWHYRAAGQSGFAEFWRALLASAAAASPRAVAAAVDRSPASPGGQVGVTVTIRDLVLADATRPAGPAAATVTAVLRREGAPEDPGVPILLWPDASPGVLRGSFRAPADTGTWIVAVTTDAGDAEVPITVDPGAPSARHEEDEVLAAFASSRGGTVVETARLRELPGILRATFRAEPRAATWHPMRSPWWIVPFALALGGEWWWRRRRGMP